MDIHRFLWTELLFIFLLLLTEKTKKSILKVKKKRGLMGVALPSLRSGKKPWWKQMHGNKLQLCGRKVKRNPGCSAPGILFKLRAITPEQR